MTGLYRFGHTLTRAMAHSFFGYRVIHRERLIEDGPAVIVCNHFSYLDPPLVGAAYRGAIWFLARKTLFRGAGGWLYPRLQCIPVDQEGSEISGLKMIIRLLRAGERVLLFPEGARSLDGRLQEGKPGVGFVIARAAVPVQPMRLFGAHDALPPGAWFPRPAKIRLVVGEPFRLDPPEAGAKSKESYQRMSDRVMAEIARLELPAEM